MIEEALKICDLLGDMSGVASMLNSLGTIYRNQGNISEALENLKKSFKICDQLKFPSDKTKILINIGQIYHSIGDNQEALNLRLKSTCID